MTMDNFPEGIPIRCLSDDIRKQDIRWAGYKMYDNVVHTLKLAWVPGQCGYVPAVRAFDEQGNELCITIIGPGMTIHWKYE